MKFRKIGLLAIGKEAEKERADFIKETLEEDIPDSLKIIRIEMYWGASLIMKGIDSVQNYNARIMAIKDES